MTDIVIIGVGSPFGPDRFGWNVVERLKDQLQLNKKKICIVNCDRPGALLLEMLNVADKAIVIDAVAGGNTGRFVKIDKTKLSGKASCFSSHDFAVAEAIALGDKLRLLPDQLLFMGVEIGEPSCSFQVTEQIYNRVIREIIKTVEIWLSESAAGQFVAIK